MVGAGGTHRATSQGAGGTHRATSQGAGGTHRATSASGNILFYYYIIQCQIWDIWV